MPNVWTVSGQSGKQMDATVRTLGADIDATAARVVFRSCAPDVFTYTVECDDSTPASSYPELTQQVTLFRDGVKFFTGVCTSLSQREDRVDVVVSGPWWYMDNTIMEVGYADGTGVNANRPSFGFSGDLRTAMTIVINAAIGAGVPMAIGTISSYFDGPTFALNQMTYGQTLSELVRLVPDAMTWFDYSTTNPTLNITRRGVATTRTIAISDCTELEAKPRLQLKLNYVKVVYADRAPNGRRRWQQQAAGSPSIGSNGISVVSGPEMDTFLPDEPLDSFSINTVPTNSSASFFRSFVNSADPLLQSLIASYGPTWWGGLGFPIYSNNSGEGPHTISYHDGPPSSSATPIQYNLPEHRFSINGQPISGTKYMVTSSGSLPDWARSENGVVTYSATLTMEIYVTVDWNPSRNEEQPIIPGVTAFAPNCFYSREARYNVYGATSYSRRSFYVYRVNLPVTLTDQPLNGTYYRQPSFVYRAPPASFAANLLAAQDWVPYDGRISMALDESGGTRYRGCKINVTGSRIAAHSSMGALVESEELDLANNLTTIHLGAPPRVDYQTWIDKSRITPQSNIQYI